MKLRLKSLSWTRSLGEGKNALNKSKEISLQSLAGDQELKKAFEDFERNVSDDTDLAALALRIENALSESPEKNECLKLICEIEKKELLGLRKISDAQRDALVGLLVESILGSKKKLSMKALESMLKEQNNGNAVYCHNRLSYCRSFFCLMLIYPHVICAKSARQYRDLSKQVQKNKSHDPCLPQVLNEFPAFILQVNPEKRKRKGKK